MAQESTVLKQTIKQKGHWTFSEIYNLCSDFLSDLGYSIAENEYSEKVSPHGKEIVLDWEAKRTLTDYFKAKITLSWRILGMQDAEIEREGKKVSTNKGDLKIDVKGILIKDYEDRWEQKNLWKFLRGVYEKYIIRTTIDEYEGRVKDDAKELVAQIKSYLQLVG